MDFKFITDEKQRTEAIEAHDSEISELKDQHKLMLDDEVNGLKSKNAEILDEKKKADAKLKEFDNYDFDAANEAMSFLENNKDAKLIKDGKVDELIEKKTSALQSDHEAAVSELNGKLQSSDTRGDLYENLYRTKMVEDALRDAAVTAKVRTKAVADVLLKGRSIFSLAEDGSVEARGQDGKLLKTVDDKVLTTSNWIDGLKKTSPHYWPDSKGAGADGSTGDRGDDLVTAIQRAAESGDQAEYLRLRKKQLG